MNLSYLVDLSKNNRKNALVQAVPLIPPRELLDYILSFLINLKRREIGTGTDCLKARFSDGVEDFDVIFHSEKDANLISIPV